MAVHRSQEMKSERWGFCPPGAFQASGRRCASFLHPILQQIKWKTLSFPLLSPLHHKDGKKTKHCRYEFLEFEEYNKAFIQGEFGLLITNDKFLEEMPGPIMREMTSSLGSQEKDAYIES